MTTATKKRMKVELTEMADRLHALKMLYEGSSVVERQFEVVRQAVRDLHNAI